jgi:hypothetical protein
MVVRRRGSHIGLTDSGQDVSLTRWSPFTPKNDSWYSFLIK